MSVSRPSENCSPVHARAVQPFGANTQGCEVAKECEIPAWYSDGDAKRSTHNLIISHGHGYVDRRAAQS